jgi:hypothetical protein
MGTSLFNPFPGLHVGYHREDEDGKKKDEPGYDEADLDQ